MRIHLLIENAYASGGTVRTTFNTAGALAARGHDVEIVSVHRRRRVSFYAVPPHVRLRPLLDAYSAAREKRPASLLGRLRLKTVLWGLGKPSVLYARGDNRGGGRNFSLASDVALVHYLRTQRDGVVVGTRPGLNVAIARWARPTVTTVGQDHMNLKSYPSVLKGEIRRHYGDLDALVTLTASDARDYAKLLRRRTTVLSIPNGVPDVGDHHAALDPSSKIVVAAGRLTPQKGYDRLVKAWAIVSAEHPDWQLRIYGGGPPEHTEDLQQLIEDLGVQHTAHLMGATKQLWAEMSKASLYVMSSRYEGFPMVLLEAMAIGLPVVAFDCPTGPRDAIDHGVDGMLVRNGDIRGLAREMDALMRDFDTRRALGAAARRKAERYDVGELAIRWEKLFAELSADKAVSSRQSVRSLASRAWGHRLPRGARTALRRRGARGLLRAAVPAIRSSAQELRSRVALPGRRHGGS
ncbi:MAG: glycosyltransferase family 4 protein [Actinomycetota bacterium]|nr:glycosyltransferase family 4 protein [Actinomycetota bacterium]